MDLNSGFRGSLDASGWRLADKPGQAPRFIPDAAPTAPGDEFWTAGYHIGGMDGWKSTGPCAEDGAGTLYTPGATSPRPARWSQPVDIAKWDGTVWSSLGSGMNGDQVLALALDGAGTLYAGGEFTTTGEVSANFIAKWDGTAWSPLGSGMNSDVLALALDARQPLRGGRVH